MKGFDAPTGSNRAVILRLYGRDWKVWMSVMAAAPTTVYGDLIPVSPEMPGSSQGWVLVAGWALSIGVCLGGWWFVKHKRSGSKHPDRKDKG